VATYVGNLIEQIPGLSALDCPSPRNNFLWNQLRVPQAAYRSGWSLYHAPAYTCPLWNFCPTVLSVHDCSYLVSEAWYPYELDRFRRAYYVASMKRAARILVPSEFSRRELIRVLPELTARVRKVFLGVSSEFRWLPDLGEETRRRFDLPDRFLLHVGDIHERRNIDQIELASRALGIPLVLVGRPLGGFEFQKRPRFLFAGINQRDLIGLYNAASTLVYPSVYEGFGLPILEAMACGLPVVAARRASIPEVCGKAAVLVEPNSEAIVEGLKEVEVARDDFVARGLERAQLFSWKKTAKNTFRVYEELL
jgi:glycosyltransferase involved in cell wall biosynthesis